MNFAKRLLLMTLSFGLAATSAIGADEQDGSRFDEELNERDFDALREYIKSRRTLDIEASTSSLTISGNVRTEYRHLNETCKGQRLRGHGCIDNKGRPISRNDFDIEFNLRFDYICGDTWATAQMRYDNSAGVDDNGHPCINNNNYDPKACCVKQANQCIGDKRGYHGSGSCDDLCLKKAFFGYELYSDCDSAFYFELGRRGNLYDVFDSNIQFLSRFDGLLLKYERSWENFADCYIQAAGFVVDERVNHFAWVSEVGFLNIADQGIDLKYSIIDWEKHGKNRCFVRNPVGFRFINSQVTAYYHLKPEFIGKKARFYGAFLINHAAKKIHVNNSKKRENLGWYAGVYIGEVRKEGDWAVEVQYQYVEAQAMPDDDSGGICRGNVLDESFTTCSRRGNTNFKGWKFEGLYAFTDHITLDTIIEWSKAANSNIGGKHTYSKLELEAIYAF